VRKQNLFNVLDADDKALIAKRASDAPIAGIPHEFDLMLNYSPPKLLMFIMLLLPKLSLSAF